MTVKPLQKIIQDEAYSIVYLQLASITFLALLAAVSTSRIVGFSLFAGGMAYGFPNLVFVWRVYRYAGAHQMNQFMTAFFFGEMLKLILSGFLFLLVVKYLPISLLSVLIGFVTAMLAFWLICLLRFSKRKVKEVAK